MYNDYVNLVSHSFLVLDNDPHWLRIILQLT